MFLLKKPICSDWFLVTKPGLIAFICLEHNENNFNSRCMKFHYNCCKFFFNFLKKVTKLTKQKKFEDFEVQIDEETFGGMINEKVYLKNSSGFKFIFQSEDNLFLFISGVADLLPSIILPNKSEVKSFLEVSFDESTLFFYSHKVFIKYWKLLKVLQNQVNNDEE